MTLVGFAEMTWFFSAVPDACRGCRALDGEYAPYESARYLFLDGPHHGCDLGIECECGCAMIGTSWTPGPPEPPVPAGLDALYDVRRARQAGNWEAARAALDRSIQLGCRSKETAVYLRIFAERSEAAGNIAEAVRGYESALEINPAVGVKRRLAKLKSAPSLGAEAHR